MTTVLATIAMTILGIINVVFLKYKLTPIYYEKHKGKYTKEESDDRVEVSLLVVFLLLLFILPLWFINLVLSLMTVYIIYRVRFMGDKVDTTSKVYNFFLGK